jgi:hypothetical protein
LSIPLWWRAKRHNYKKKTKHRQKMEDLIQASLAALHQSDTLPPLTLTQVRVAAYVAALSSDEAPPPRLCRVSLDGCRMVAVLREAPETFREHLRGYRLTPRAAAQFVLRFELLMLLPKKKKRRLEEEKKDDRAPQTPPRRPCGGGWYRG